MAGGGDWRGGARGNAGGGRGWTQQRPPQEDWNWRGQTPGGQFVSNQMGGAANSGIVGQGFGSGGHVGQFDQRPQQGGFNQGDFYNYSGGFQCPPQMNQGMNFSPSNLSGNFGQNISRPLGGVEQLGGGTLSGAGVAAVTGGNYQGQSSNFPFAQQFVGPRFPVNQKQTGSNPPVQKTSASGGAGPGKVVLGLCYRCSEPGHGIKDCKATVLCEVCGKNTHISENCALPNHPKPVAALIGCGGEGLQMFTALTSRKIDPDKAKQDIALVTVHSGEINVQQLVDSFSKLFQWGWEWKARPYLANSFLVKFPSVQKIEEMKGYEYFGLPGLNAAVKVSKWDNVAMAKYKLYVVWVRITGIPESLLHYHGICEAASLIGKVKEVDMKMFRRTEIVRVKMGVKDPRKIPAVAPLNDEDFIYDIWFELEDIVEQGGPMLGGALVITQIPGPTNGSQIELQTANTNPAVVNQGNNLQEGSQQQLGAGNEKSGQQAETDLNNQSLMENEEIISSQYELDKQWQEAKAREAERVNISNILEQQGQEVDGKIQKAAADEEMTEREYGDEEVDYGCSEDPDEFARKVGLSTQRIREIDSEIAEEEIDKENIAPVKGDVEVSQGFVVTRGNKVTPTYNSFADAQERIKKAKAKADMDEAVLRRSVRNKKNEDQHAMDRCEDMAKKRNLEAIPGRKTTTASATGD